MNQKLFTLGPVEMFDYTKERLAEQLPYFRTNEFSRINLDNAERLKSLAGAEEDAHVFILTCSGTGAMEAVVGGCFNEKDNLLAIDGGGFGHRFVELALGHGIPCKPIKLEFEKVLGQGMLEEEFKGGSPGFTGLLVNLHETSTGQLYDRNYLASFCKENNLYFICDAIGSFLADPIDMKKDGIDALIISSQKGLALPPGLSIVIMSDRLFKKIEKDDIRPFAQYFDFREAEKDAVRGQTPFTPAVGTILTLSDRLKKIEEEGGAQASVLKTETLANDFRNRLSGLIEKGLIKIPNHPLSNACTPLIFPNGGAGIVYKELCEAGVWLNPNGGALADKILRVGHLGNLTIKDNEMLVGLLEGIVK